MVWTCRAQHRLDCRSTQAECGCTEKIWQAKEIMGRSAWEWQKEARYGFCWLSKSFWVERTPSKKFCKKAQPSVEENRALKWIWWWSSWSWKDGFGLLCSEMRNWFLKIVEWAKQARNKTASHARCPATAVISSKWQISHVKSKESCKVPVKFQKDWPKTVGGVADTRHILPIHIYA